MSIAQWLEADLGDVDRCVTPWLFVGMHRPMYVPYPHKSNRIVGRHLQDILEDLFLEREVDLVMTGHVHLYARTCSVRRDHCRQDDDGGITHVTVGEQLLSAPVGSCLRHARPARQEGASHIIVGRQPAWPHNLGRPC